MAFPQVTNQSPPPDGRWIDDNTNIFLYVIGADLDVTLIDIYVNGVIAWTSDAQQAGFAVTKTVVGGGFSYDINPDVALPTNKITAIQVTAEDTGGNTSNIEYQFMVEDLVFPDDNDNTGGIEDEVDLNLDHVQAFFPANPVISPAGIEEDLEFPSHIQIQHTNTTGIEDEIDIESGHIEVLYQDGPQNAPAGIEDTLVNHLSSTPKWNFTTFDDEGHPHFVAGAGDIVAWEGFFYDARNDPWANPTLNNFTGYGRDGTHYTNGVQDGGPVFAPWSAEAAGTDRSSRADFPNRSLIHVMQGGIGEVTIYDLDNFDGTAGSLIVWMRFRMGDASNFYMLGRVNYSPRNVKMKNGTLVVATQDNGIERGGVFIIDFKLDGSQEAGNLIRSDNHWRLFAGKDITDRNTVSVWDNTLDGSAVELRINSEYVYRVAMHCELISGVENLWVATTGEDAGSPTVVFLQDGISKTSSGTIGDQLGGAGNYWTRNVLMDRDGWLWVSQDNRIWRNGQNYKEGRIYQYSETSVDPRRLQQKGVTIPAASIHWLAAARQYIFAGSDEGVYAVNRGTLEVHLAYTVAGKGGKGNSPAGTNEGELMLGGNNRPYKFFAFDLSEAGYVVIATTWAGQTDEGGDGGSSTVVRLLDDFVVHQVEFPDLFEDGAYVSVPFYK